ncbi:hypothetical protein DTQ70_03845 [Runella sp. SP2]|nr:hypothetical protein DTQ70_03845 [Runella sp. SP2]
MATAVGRQNLLSKKLLTHSISASSGAPSLNYNVKMIANEKEFRTITLRGLDEKPEIVAIMNKVMKTHGLKTGQSVIERIIIDYEELQNGLAAAKRELQNQKTHFERNSKSLAEELEGYRKIVKDAQNAFNQIMTLSIK